jgi:S-adenosylmethionine:tRNA ribosyltransferase-isomerase
MHNIEDYDYELPADLIAQEPAPKRDESRLLCIDRSGKDITDHRFFDLPLLLKEGDLLVVNDAKVVPARLYGKKETGGQVEILVLEHSAESAAGGQDKRWCLMRASKRPKIGSKIIFSDDLTGIVDELGEDGMARVGFEGKHGLDEILEKRGCLPLPPYIKRSASDKRTASDRERYQTIFASFSGAVAAPTAGLHFTPDLLLSLKSRGIDIITVTLLVGHDTFRPVRVKDIRDHRLAEESYNISRDSAGAIRQAKMEGRRVVAVGTTVVRALEGMFQNKKEITGDSGTTNLLIYPGFNFQVIDALVTNFHLPRSSLFFMVAAFTGIDLIKRAYHRAVEKRYRFYSYGDAMLIS